MSQGAVLPALSSILPGGWQSCVAGDCPTCTHRRPVRKETTLCYRRLLHVYMPALCLRGNDAMLQERAPCSTLTCLDMPETMMPCCSLVTRY